MRWYSELLTAGIPAMTTGRLSDTRDSREWREAMNYGDSRTSCREIHEPDETNIDSEDDREQSRAIIGPTPRTTMTTTATYRRTDLRNVAIIAHVDHGKTTLVDALLTHAGTIAGGGQACVLDSDPLERERGITIFSKNCAIDYVAEGADPIRVNLIDTPGHADFGGEVERVLRMADGALLIVDAFEGPMPQTRFVVQKALELGLRLIVVVNKCDRPDARAEAVIDEVFDLLVALGADDETLDFPVVYASARDGWTAPDPVDAGTGMSTLLDVIVDKVPGPESDVDGPLRMLVTSLDYSEYVGRIAIGRVYSGSISRGQSVAICRADGVDRGRAQNVNRFEGLSRTGVESISAGDLCAIEGLAGVDIGDTIADPEQPEALPRVEVDEPTLHMVFRINDGPFSGKEGQYVTSRQIEDRLRKEREANVALRVENGDSAEEFRVSGRGLLHLGVVLENMRREGYELTVGRPEVVIRDIDGVPHEPVELATVDTASDAMGGAMELLGARGGTITSVDSRGDRTHIEAEMPARGLIGLRSRLLTATQGEAILFHSFLRWEPVRPMERKRPNGVLIATETGQATMYSLLQLSERAVMFVKPGDPIYAGQIVGENSRDNDMGVNVTKAKAFSNVRESNKEATVTLKAPRDISLEVALEYLEDDELVEVTPESIRLRKRLLSESDRKRLERAEKSRRANA